MTHGNHYQVDVALVGQRVELVFDPFDLTAIEVRSTGERWVSPSTPHRPPLLPRSPPQPHHGDPPATGIDYLRLVETQRDRDVAAAGGITFHQLGLPDELLPQPTATKERSS